MLSSRSETESLGTAIGEAAKGGEVLALIGELGAGKTALVRGIAGGLGAPADSVTSPTFVLIHEYPGRLSLIHVDLYRLRSESEASNIGLEDYFSDRSVAAIEWADRFPALLPDDRLEILLVHKAPDTRTAQVRALGPRSLSVLAEVKKTWKSSHRRHQARTTRRKTTTP